QTTFIASPVAYKLGQQQQWAGFSERLVSAYLEQAVAPSHSAMAAHQRALEVAEGSKSRLLAELLGRDDLPVPLSVSAIQAAQERELLAALTTLDTAELATYTQQSISQERASHLEHLQRRHRYLHDLNEIWEEMAQLGSEAADYVALRRG